MPRPIIDWLGALKQIFTPVRKKQRSSRQHAIGELEPLEDRCTPTIFGNPISSEAYPYSAATKIYAYWAASDSWYLASGTMVDSYHVLTAAHVIYDNAEGGYADKVIVLPGYSGYNGADFDDM